MAGEGYAKRAFAPLGHYSQIVGRGNKNNSRVTLDELMSMPIRRETPAEAAEKWDHLRNGYAKIVENAISEVVMNSSRSRKCATKMITAIESTAAQMQGHLSEMEVRNEFDLARAEIESSSAALFDDAQKQIVVELVKAFVAESYPANQELVKLLREEGLSWQKAIDTVQAAAQAYLPLAQSKQMTEARQAAVATVADLDFSKS